MKKQSSPIFGLGILVFLLLFVPPIIAQEVEDEREFDYFLGSKKGPKQWEKLKEEWAACSNGQMQSPVDFSDQEVTVVPEFGDLMKRRYQLGNATLRCRGHDVMVQWADDAGSIEINGTEYKLQQGHWHSPSEHTINGKRYDLELHLVHKCLDPSVKNRVVVVGHLYQFGQPDAFLSEENLHAALPQTPIIMSSIASLAIDMERSYLGPIHPDNLKLGVKKYYKYIGSLTVPPCDEGVIWIINTEVSGVSIDQVKQLRSAVHHDYAVTNERPLQALNNRDVHLHKPKA